MKEVTQVSTLIRDNPGKKTIWANIILVLDRPLIDKILFEDLDKKIKDNSFPLLENGIDEINEHQMLSIYLMIILYYAREGRQLLARQDKINILVHIHQDVVGLIGILKELLNKLPTSDNVSVSFESDHYTFISSEHDYQGVDILISLGQCAGLEPKWNPGDMILAREFIPFDIESNQIRMGDTYTVENNLLTSMNNMINSEFNLLAVHCVNEYYQSANRNKQYKATLIKPTDFKQGPILQVDALWNPTDENKIVNF